MSIAHIAHPVVLTDSDLSAPQAIATCPAHPSFASHASGGGLLARSPSLGLDVRSGELTWPLR
jgi:hypothetical protein